MNPKERVYNLLASAGAVMKRRKNHEVWGLPNGRTFVRACTSSDIRSDLNNLSDLKHALGVVSEQKAEKPVATAEKPAKKGVARPVRYPANNTLAEKLSASGVTYEALASRMADAERRIAELEEFKNSVTSSKVIRWLLRG